MSSRLLTREEEQKLGQTIVAGNSPEATQEEIDFKNTAIEILVEHNHRLVHSIVRKFCQQSKNPHLYDDLVQQGFCGLIIAANKFDPEVGTKFSTYATNWIKQSVGRYNRTKTRSLSIPDAKVLEHYRKLKKTPEDEELLPVNNDVENAMKPTALILSTGAFDEEFKNSFIPSVNSFEEDVVTEISVRESLSFIKNACTVREYDVIRHRCGFVTGSKMTFVEIAEELGMTPANANALYSKGIKKIRAMNNNEQLFT